MFDGGDDALLAVGANQYRADSFRQANVRWQTDRLHAVDDKNSSD